MRIAVALVDPTRLPSSAHLAQLSEAFADKLILYDLDRLELAYLGDAACAIAVRSRITDLVVVDLGMYSQAAVDGLVARLAAVAQVRREPRSAAGDLVVVAGPAGASHAGQAQLAVFLGTALDRPVPEGTNHLVLERANAFRGTLPRWLRAQAALSDLPVPESVR